MNISSSRNKKISSSSLSLIQISYYFALFSGPGLPRFAFSGSVSGSTACTPVCAASHSISNSGTASRKRRPLSSSKTRKLLPCPRVHGRLSRIRDAVASAASAPRLPRLQNKSVLSGIILTYSVDHMAQLLAHFDMPKLSDNFHWHCSCRIRYFTFPASTD